MVCIMPKEWTLELMFGYFIIMMRTMFSSKEEEQQFYSDKTSFISITQIFNLGLSTQSNYLSL